MATEARDAAIRDAKRYVREIVRNDWVFELSSEPGVPSFSSPPTPDQDVLRWRQREYDSSGSELEPQPSPAISPVGGHNASELASPLGTPLSDDSERRRKRRRQMEEEMQWNAGLRTWVERRDAWSGALSRDEIRAREARTQQAATPTTSSSEQQPPHNASVPAATTVATPPLSASSANSQNDLALRTEASLSIAENDSALPRPPSRGEEPSTAAEQPPPPPPAGDDENQGGESSSSADTGLSQPDSAHQQLTSEDPFIPVVSSLISNDNPIRASITPAMYPSIYSKVVIQGLTPTVPINLADVTKAMVQGWKSDGQWPPKPSSIVLQDTATVRPKPEEPADKPPSSPESKRRSGVASAVRKVFHFSGFHPHHPFHRRGSSSQQNEGNAEGSVNQ